jgi:hypothetical protein
MESKTISLRMPAGVAQAIARVARTRRVTKSRVILESVEALLARAPDQSAWDVGSDLFGQHGSGRRDTSTRRRQAYRDSARAKHAHR